ncbi:MAG: histidinol-phosphatase [Pseudomonadota bacterium]
MFNLTSHDLTDLVALANRLADAAAKASLPHFRARSLDTENKEVDGFDPVTIADRAAEQAMRDVLAVERPNDGVFGEEQERTHGTSGLTWVLDPIDGTRAFISGLPVWGTLIALDDGAEGRIGVIDQPFTGERYIGVVDGAQSRALLARDGQQTPITTRKDVPLAEATVFTTDPYIFEDAAEMACFEAVRDRARLTRYGTDCYAYALVALGTVDLVIESGLAAYDVASHVPLIRAAGGVVTDWEGNDCRWGGTALAAGSPELHEEALELLRSAS